MEPGLWLDILPRIDAQFTGIEPSSAVPKKKGNSW